VLLCVLMGLLLSFVVKKATGGLYCTVLHTH
jgi:hypothetical protein